MRHMTHRYNASTVLLVTSVFRCLTDGILCRAQRRHALCFLCVRVYYTCKSVISAGGAGEKWQLVITHIMIPCNKHLHLSYFSLLLIKDRGAKSHNVEPPCPHNMSYKTPKLPPSPSAYIQILGFIPAQLNNVVSECCRVDWWVRRKGICTKPSCFVSLPFYTELLVI